MNKNRELEKEYIQKMEDIEMWDEESPHINADWILADFLRELGYKDIVEAWKQIPKWYAKVGHNYHIPSNLCHKVGIGNFQNDHICPI